MATPRTAAALAINLIRAALRPHQALQPGQFDAVFFSGDHNKTDTTLDGLRYDRHLDPIRETLHSDGFTTLGIAKPPALISSQNTFFSSLNIDRWYLKALVLDAFCRRNGRGCFRYKLFLKLLTATDPKVVFGIGGRNYLWEAARDLGIPYVEVLHAKGFPNTVSLFPPGGGMPSYFVAFDELSVSSIKESSKEDPEIYLVKDYWVDGFRKHRADFLKRKGFFRLPPAIERFPLRILVTLHPRPSKKLRRALVSLVTILGPEAFWLFRLHPTQMFQQSFETRQLLGSLSRVGRDNLNTDHHFSSKAPLPEVLGAATHHLTQSSSSSYEAAEFGVPTLAVSDHWTPETQAQLQPLEERGALNFAKEDLEVILDWILTVRTPLQNHWNTKGSEIRDILPLLMNRSSGSYP